jgi:hypothetical protein
MGETQQAFLTLFLISSLARVGALLLLARVTGVMAVVRRSLPMVLRLTSINPTMGSIDRPILPSMPAEPQSPQPATLTAKSAHQPPLAA